MKKEVVSTSPKTQPLRLTPALRHFQLIQLKLLTDLHRGWRWQTVCSGKWTNKNSYVEEVNKGYLLVDWFANQKYTRRRNQLHPCLHLLWSRGSLHWSKTHPPCKMMPSLLLCVLFFNIRYANDDHLASFPTSTSTVYGHVLVLTWGSVKYYSHITHCLVTVVMDTAHACLGTVASTPHPYRAWAHRNCARDHLFKQTRARSPSRACLCLHPSNELDVCGSTVSGPLVWKHPNSVFKLERTFHQKGLHQPWKHSTHSSPGKLQTQRDPRAFSSHHH